MKTYIFLPILLVSASIYGQRLPISVSEIKDNYWKSTLCSVDTVISKSNDVLAVILYKVSNPSGSAHMPESDEVSNRFLIAVSSVDDSPEQHLFNVGDFYGPKILQFEELDRNNYRVLFSYGAADHRKKKFLNISLNKVTVTDD
jgi:hypothetical protein